MNQTLLSIITFQPLHYLFRRKAEATVSESSFETVLSAKFDFQDSHVDIVATAVFHSPERDQMRRKRGGERKDQAFDE
jgi:hypothetical protein